MQTASDVIACPTCPTKFLSAIQNTQLLGTLLVSIAERYSKVVQSITTECERAERGCEIKTFQVADVGAFSIDLSPSEWRWLCKKVVRAEIYGPVPSEANRPENPNIVPCSATYLMALVERMQERQQGWHKPDHQIPDDFPRGPDGKLCGGPQLPKDEHICLKLAGFAVRLVECIDWS